MIINTLGELRERMTKWFSRDEIRTLCFDLNPTEELYEELGGENLPKSGKIRELIRYAHKNNQLLNLIAMVERTLVKGEYNIDVEWLETRLQMQRLQASTLTDKDFVTMPPPFQAPRKPLVYVKTDVFEEASTFLRQYHNQAAILGIHGYAGVGKSTLALHLAHQFRDVFEDGVLWFDLANPHQLNASLVTAALAYGQGEQISQATDLSSKAQIFTQLLSNRHVLVVIDHADSNETLLEWLLPNGRRNIVVVNTRKLDKLRHLTTSHLILPAFTVEQTLEYFRLLLTSERIDAEIEAARQLHELMGGIPQILTIAAGQLQASPTLKIADYNTLFSNETTRLQDISNATETELAIAASLEVSYSALKERARQIFAILGVFEGFGFDIWAVASVTGVNDVLVQLALGQLGNQSLIHHVFEGRYKINALVKAFALSRLHNPDQYYRRAAEYYATIASQSLLQNGFRELSSDWKNVVGLMNWAYRAQNWELLIKGVLGLTQFSLGVMGFLDLRGYWSVARELLTIALEGAQQSEDMMAELQIRLNLAGFAYKQQDQSAMSDQLDHAEKLFAKLAEHEAVIFNRYQYFDLKAKAMWQIDRSKASDPLLEGVKLLATTDIENAHYQRGYLYSELSGTLARSGRFEQALEAAQQSLSFLPSWPTTAQLVGMINLGVILRQTGRVEESSEWLQQAVNVAEEIGDTNRLGSTWVNLGVNNKHLGRLIKANEYFAKALSIYQRSGNIHYQIGTQLNMGQLNFILGDEAEAHNLYSQALALAVEHNVRDVEASLYSNQADLFLVNGDANEAADVLSMGWELCQEVGLKHLQPTVMRQQVQVLQAQGKHKQAAQAIEHVLREAGETKDLLEQGIAWRVKGVSLAAVGKTSEALAAMQRSLAILAGQEVFEYGRTLVALAEIRTQRGESDEARTLLQEAMKIFSALPARRELRQVNELLGSLI